MKHLLSNPYLVLLTRVFLGCLFIFFSLDKIVNPDAFAQSINNYRIVSPDFATVAATVLPWLELLCGLGILFGGLIRGSALLLSSMLFVFTIAVISALLRGLDISCGCFTQDPAADRIGWTKVAQNLSLLVLGLYLLLSRTTRFTLEEYLRSSSADQ